jgi:hypothetical protein
MPFKDKELEMLSKNIIESAVNRVKPGAANQNTLQRIRLIPKLPKV